MNRFSLRIFVCLALTLASLNLLALNESLDLQESIFIDPQVAAVTRDISGEERNMSDNNITAGAATYGISFVSTEHVSTVNIPLSYAFNAAFFVDDGFLILDAGIPLVSSEDPFAGSNSGPGDISIGASHYYNTNGYTTKAGVSFRLPTGDADKALGTGATNLSLNFNARKKFKIYEGIMRLGYILRGSATIRGADYDYGDTVAFTFGTDHRYSADTAIETVVTHLSSKGTINKTSSFAFPDLNTTDLLITVSYRDISAGIAVPLIDDLAAGNPRRKSALNITWSSAF